MSTTSTKPKSCDHNCFACVYSDCLFDGVTDEERELQDRTDERLIERKLEGSAVIHTGKPGRPRKIRDEEAVKEARKIKNRKYYDEHKAERQSYQRKYYSEHKEYYRQYEKENYNKDPEKRKAASRERYYKNMNNFDFAEKERVRALERYRKRKERLANG